MIEYSERDETQGFEIWQYTLPESDISQLVFMQDYLPTIRAKCVHDNDEDGKVYAFDVVHPEINGLVKLDFTRVAESQNIDSVLHDVFQNVQRRDENLISLFGFNNPDYAQQSHHIQELREWFGIRAYLQHFHIEDFFGHHYYDSIKQYTTDHSSSAAQYIRHYAPYIFHKTVHATLKKNVNIDNVRDTPLPWLRNIIQAEVVATVSAFIEHELSSNNDFDDDIDW